MAPFPRSYAPAGADGGRRLQPPPDRRGPDRGRQVNRKGAPLAAGCRVIRPERIRAGTLKGPPSCPMPARLLPLP